MLTYRIFLLSISCLFFSFISHAQWKDIGLPNGFQYKDSYIDSKSGLFIQTVDAIYYSSDYGQTLINTNRPADFDLAGFVELENQDILVCNKTQVYKFNRSAKAFDLFIDAPYYVSSIDHHGNIWCYNFIDGKNELYTSKDFGKTYQLIDTPKFGGYCDIYAIDSFKDSFSIFLINCDDVFRIYKEVNNSSFSLIDESALKSSFLFINQKSGTTFTYNKDYYLSRLTLKDNLLTPVNYPDGPGFKSLKSLKLLKNGNLVLEADDSTYISENDGILFKNIQDYLYPEALHNLSSITSISILNSSDSILLAESGCLGAGIYLSVDKGKNWDFKNDNLKYPFIYSLFEDKQGSLYARTCSEYTLLVSKDEGQNWQKFYINLNASLFPTTIIKMNMNGDLYAKSGTKLFKSSDGGLSFIDLNIPTAPFEFWGFSDVIVANQKYIYVLNNYKNAIFSDDDGNSWKTINFNEYYVAGKSFIDKKGNLYASTPNHGIIKYDLDLDNTVQFNSVKNKIIRNFALTKTGKIYFYDISKNTLWISNDTLKSIEVLDSLLSYKHVDDLFTDDSGFVFLQTYQEFQISKDNGKTFKHFAPLPTDLSTWNYLSDKHNLYSFTNDIPGIFLLGSSWTSTVSHYENENIEFYVYPNPTRGELKLNIENSKSQDYTLCITDILRKELFSEKWSGSSYDFKPKGVILPGIYFINITDDKGKTGFAKFVVQ
ncbi:MAG TPA: T9SS type A sorting domain-containing protein [Saprospiraceae bacterium]|nr:T9SS type A sorting domain-containing protein [Saprospiraceae bacterium]